MSAPIYFFVGLTTDKIVHQDKLVRQTLERFGLNEQFGDVRSVEREVGVWDGVQTKLGPEQNLCGAMLRAFSRAADGSMLAGQRLGFFPERQTWSKVFEANDTQLWIGVDNDAPPGPHDLSRRRQFSGYTIELGDGAEWLIPVIRRPDGSSALPCVMDTHDGKYRERVRQQYRQLWEDTATVVEWFETGAYAMPQIRPQALPMAVRAIGQNYRFGAYEQQVLGLIDSENYLSVLLSAVDWPLVRAIAEQKKTQEPPEPEPTTTTTGSAEESPTIAPAVAS